MARTPRHRRLVLPLLCLLFQGATALLFAVFVRYNHETDAALWHWGNHSNVDNKFYFRYPSFQDVHAMVFVGFGFLMVFLQRYGFSSVGFTFLVAAFTLQWATLVQGFLHSFHGGHIHVSVESLINADFCAGAVLISFGAVLGKTGPAQLLLMALLETVLFSVNEFILLSLLGVRDAGGSMTIHTFGAYFGLFLSRVLYRSQLEKSRHRQSSVYHSDLFAMIGTIFLWIFWPSFNSAPTALGDVQHRTALNTYYSLTASTLSTFALSALVSGDGRLDMVHIQNAALAGGVVVGTSGEMMLTPFGAVAAGFLAGTVSTLGYKFFTVWLLLRTWGEETLEGRSLHQGREIPSPSATSPTRFWVGVGECPRLITQLVLQPVLEFRFKIQDTCGVHNLHGMPGLLGALLGVLVTWLATHEAYGDGLQNVFPLIAAGQRSATSQAVYQLFGMFVTLVSASVGGSLGGLLLRLPFLDSPPDAQCFEDQVYWEVPGEQEAEVQRSLRAEERDSQA